MIKLGYLFALLVVIATAQKTTPDGFELWTADLLTQVEEALKTDAACNPQHVSVQHLADFPNDTFMLARRDADGVAEWHETQTDIFFVRSGSATLVVGGNMMGGTTVEPHEKRNGIIEGGVQRKLVPGMLFAFLLVCLTRSCSMARRDLRIS